MKNNKFWPYHPRYWIYWLVLGILRLISGLPYRLLLKLGAGLGWLIRRLAKRSYKNTQVNLRLCYPELTDKQRDKLLRHNFRSVGIGIFELLLSWWASDRRLSNLAHITGLEHIDKALEAGKGVIVAAPHFTTLELALRLFGRLYPVAVMYNRQKHAWFEYFNQKALNKYYAKAIPKENARAMVKVLKQNKIVCYTPDVDPGRNSGVFVPFFDIPAATVTGTTRFAAMTGAQVLFAAFYRREDESGYDLIVTPLPLFPSEDVIQDASFINRLVEGAIRFKPEQYIWQYKRFKTRPEGERCFYE